MRYLVIISVFIALTVFSAKPLPGQTPAEKPTYPSQEDAPAPELELTDLTGTKQKLSSLRGRIVVLNFWATYCLPCREEMPALATIQNRYGPYGVQVIGATADLVDDKEDVLEFVKKTKVNFPVWLEATNVDLQRFTLGPALPGTAIIDREGKIVWTKKKAVTAAELRTQLDALLFQQDVKKTVRGF